MIKALRKRHLQIWTVWLVLIPVGITVACLAIPSPHADKLLQTSQGHALPVLIKLAERKNYTVALRTDSNSSIYQLEWKNKTASVYPSSLVYLLNDMDHTIEQAVVAGRVEAKGIFYFPLLKDSLSHYHFVLYDIIHHQSIDTINF